MVKEKDKMNPILAYVIAAVVVYLAFCFMVVILPRGIKMFYEWLRSL